MNLPKNTPILHMDSPTFADDLAKELGPGPYEITTPQFHRTDEANVSAPIFTTEDWANLGKLPLDRVRNLGCQMWGEDAKGIHWLLKDIYKMGCLWNQDHQVIFTNEDQDSQIDEGYQQELLKKAQ